MVYHVSPAGAQSWATCSDDEGRISARVRVCNGVAFIMAGLKKLMCLGVVAAHVAAFSAAQAEELSPQRAATGTGSSVAAQKAAQAAAKQAAAGNASGGEAQDQPPPYIPPSHGVTQALVLGSIAAAAAVGAFLAANKQNETTSTTSTQ